MKSQIHCSLGASMENNIFPCPSGNDNIDNFDGPSRKRKSVAVDLPSFLSGYCVAWDSNMPNVSSLSGTNGKGNIYEQSSSLVNCLRPTNLGHQFGNNQIHCENDFSEARSISNRNLFRAAAERTSNPSISVQPFPFTKMLSQGTPEMQSFQPHRHVLLGQTEVDRSSSSEKACNGQERKPEICPGLREQMRFGINNHVLTDELQQEACIASPDHLRPVERLQQAFLQPNSLFDCLNLRNSSQKVNSDSNNLLTARTDSFGGSICKNLSENDRISQNQGKFGRGNFTDHLGDASEGKKRDNRGSDNNLDKENKASNVGTVDCSSKEKFSSKAGDSPPTVLGHGQRTNSTDVSLKLDDKNMLHSGMATSAAGEKLWDGYLQLNSSVTVSAVAFFKSGEKLLDTNWSEFVEVKGKVRLEAFEKYVQDLPRSRTRGLMVISLCCKEGSSDIRLIGMKKVAKGYKKGEKVGLAQLSPAIDLYICPRSDKIITILAKYGFYKGMAAVECNQDSLIGCVVWRKNRASTNTVAAKSKGKNSSSLDMLPKSSSEFSSQQAAKKNSSPVQLAQEVISFTAARPFLTPESVEGSAMEAKKVEAVEVSIEVVSNSSVANSLLTYSAPGSCSYNLEAHASSHDGSIQGSGGNLVGPKAFHRPFSGVVHQGQVLEQLQESASSAVMKDSIAANDDDLPEFDFRTACGHSAVIMKRPSGAVLLGKTFPAGIIRIEDGFKTSTMPTLESISLSCRRSDNSTLPAASVNQEMPLVKGNGDSEPLVSLSYNLEDKSHVKSLATATTPGSVFGSARNFFNGISKKNNTIFDDDDMPEWCPPELLKQSSVEEIRPLTAGPYFSNLTIHKLRSGAQRPLLPSSSAAAAHLMISSQASPAFHHLPHVNVVTPPSIAVQSATDPVKWFACNPVLRPQFSSFNSYFSFQSADRRGWRQGKK